MTDTAATVGTPATPRPASLPAVDPARVRAWLGLPAGADTDAVEWSADAATAFVARLPHVGPDAAAWDPDTALGAVMLAGRIYRRRNTPSGVEAFTDVSTAYVARNDPDISRLLRIGLPRTG